MKITMAQVNPIVGDIEYNVGLLNEAAHYARRDGSDMLVLPELCLTGYPPRDLLEQGWFLEQVHNGLQEVLNISRHNPDLGLIIGIPGPSSLPSGKGLFNSALFIASGEIAARQHKSLLPVYDVFDEGRYFDPAPELAIFEFKGEKIGLTICEDAWNDPEFWPEHLMYEADPVALVANMGATLLINISASPFHAGKEALRRRLIRNHAMRHRRPFIYVNQVGGNDELIFDGRSMFFDANGNCLNQLPGFSSCTATFDTASQQILPETTGSDEAGEIYEALVLGLRDYVHKCGFQQVVLGLSGGIDSAVTACIAAEALGSSNVLGITMPGPFSSEGSVSDSASLAARLNIEIRCIPVSTIYEAYLSTLSKDLAATGFDLTEENIQARIRGNILMAFSNKYRRLVLSTGNKSELAVGYCTLYGDMSGGLGVIADVPKTMVYKLAAYINSQRAVIPVEIIEKAPSAELRPGQVDADSLPPYPLLDRILHLYIEKSLSPRNIIDLGYDSSTVQWVVQAVERNEYKRKQAAPGLKVTTKAFGAGRRMPIAARLHL